MIPSFSLMLFNSLEFITIFLPLTLAVYFALAKISQKLSLGFVAIASCVFVAWKEPAFLYLILISIVVNFWIFRLLLIKKSKGVFFVGLLFNLSYLIYFKYFNFILESSNLFFSTHFERCDILLPLAISFYTFQQISFLHDTLKGEISERSFLDYALFILFFPQLIAGPILRHNELDFSKQKPHFTNLSVGLSIFSMGLFKKVLIADHVGIIANALFGAVSKGQILYFFEAWIALIAFSFQIYFDFSGYCDMAVGLGRLFNMKFPQNFNSPYKATNIIDFWHRWHISLSTFLKENIYIPLGGGRRGQWRKSFNLTATMLIGGLWHGASWTFVAWGGLHALFLTVNHFLPKKKYRMMLGKQIFVFIIVSLAWIFFRADNFKTAISLFKSCLGLNGFSLPTVFAKPLFWVNDFFGSKIIISEGFSPIYTHFVPTFVFLFIIGIVVFFFPNTFDWHYRFSPSLDYQNSKITEKKWFRRLSWKPNFLWAPVVILILFYSFSFISGKQEFIYFQF